MMKIRLDILLGGVDMKISNIRKEHQVLIIGCGRLGASIANTLSNKNKYVTIVDMCETAFGKLSPSFGGLSLEGDGTNIEVLKEAGIQKVEVIIVVTNNDNINIMIAQMARKLFYVKEVIVRLYDPEKECIYKGEEIHTILPALLSASEINKILELKEKNYEK